MEIYIVSGIVISFISLLTGVLTWMFKRTINNLIAEVSSFQMEIKYLQAQNDAQNYAHQKRTKNNGNNFTKNYTQKLDELLKKINFKKVG